MFSSVKNLRIVLNNLILYLKRGGVTHITLSEISYNRILYGKKVLITGGSSGIGLAIARKFISEGAKVVITGRDEKNY